METIPACKNSATMFRISDSVNPCCLRRFINDVFESASSSTEEAEEEEEEDDEDIASFNIWRSTESTTLLALRNLLPSF